MGPGEHPIPEGSGMREMDLEAVVRLAGLGESEAFAELYRRFAQRVQGLCRHMLGSKESAEDATSEVFMRLQRSVNSYDGSVPFQSWLFSIASHYCVDRLRSRQVKQRWIVDADAESLPGKSAATSPLGEAITAERNAEVRDAISRLPEKYRLPLVLRYYSDLSYDEIARQLGLKRPTVATLIFRAKQELRLALASREGMRTQ